MINNGQINAEELKIQGLLDRYLQFNTANKIYNGNEDHLDDDQLTAFVEGRIGEKESSGMISHLVKCSFCLHVTGELTKLSSVFAEDEVSIAAPVKEPMKVSEVLSGLLSRIFGTNDGAVFAHHEEEKTEEEKSDKKDE